MLLNYVDESLKKGLFKIIPSHLHPIIDICSLPLELQFRETWRLAVRGQKNLHRGDPTTPIYLVHSGNVMRFVTYVEIYTDWCH